MSILLKFSVFIFVLCFTCPRCTFCLDYGTIKWVSAKDFDEDKQTPTGMEYESGTGTAFKMYTTRKIIDGGYYCGKYIPLDKLAYYPKDATEVWFKEDQGEILSYPSGSISWTYSFGQRPFGVLIGGKTIGNQTSYPCRALHLHKGKKLLIPGKYLDSVEKCIVPYGRKEHLYERFEFPVVNNLGRLLGADKNIQVAEDGVKNTGTR